MTKCDWCGKNPASQVGEWDLCYNCLERLEDTAPKLLRALETILAFLDEMAAFLDGDLAVWADTCRRTARAAIKDVKGGT